MDAVELELIVARVNFASTTLVILIILVGDYVTRIKEFPTCSCKHLTEMATSNIIVPSNQIITH